MGYENNYANEVINNLKEEIYQLKNELRSLKREKRRKRHLHRDDPQYEGFFEGLNNLGEKIALSLKPLENLGEVIEKRIKDSMGSLEEVLDNLDLQFDLDWDDKLQKSELSKEDYEIIKKNHEILKKLLDGPKTLEELAGELSEIQILRENKLIVQEKFGKKRYLLTRKGRTGLSEL